mmetsp:Transcript_3359/g.5006  ORF Transcript_3359/g.5006 Transcript_3359/m.5006 type:complete len:112 (+) Transcript_3359:114-449(+)
MANNNEKDGDGNDWVYLSDAPSTIASACLSAMQDKKETHHNPDALEKDRGVQEEGGESEEVSKLETTQQHGKYLFLVYLRVITSWLYILVTWSAVVVMNLWRSRFSKAKEY